MRTLKVSPQQPTTLCWLYSLNITGFSLPTLLRLAQLSLLMTPCFATCAADTLSWVGQQPCSADRTLAQTLAHEVQRHNWHNPHWELLKHDAAEEVVFSVELNKIQTVTYRWLVSNGQIHASNRPSRALCAS